MELTASRQYGHAVGEAVRDSKTNTPRNDHRRTHPKRSRQLQITMPMKHNA
jgi:hypothetical protein